MTCFSIDQEDKIMKAISFDPENNLELVYYSKLGGAAKLFGTEFVNFNRNNIELTINNENKKHKIIDTFYLSKGENKIKIFIKAKLSNLSYMFYNCNSLKNISELRYLDTSEVKNFSYLFWGCSSLTDISPLYYWDVSKGEDFSYAFLISLATITKGAKTKARPRSPEMRSKKPNPLPLLPPPL